MSPPKEPLNRTFARALLSLFCLHRGEKTFVRNIHGDEVIHRGYKRSIWQCNHCGATCLDDNYHPVEYRENPSQTA